MISNQFRRSGWVTSLSPTLYLAPFSLTGIIWNARKNITWIRGKTVSFVLSLKNNLLSKHLIAWQWNLLKYFTLKINSSFIKYDKQKQPLIPTFPAIPPYPLFYKESIGWLYVPVIYPWNALSYVIINIMDKRVLSSIFFDNHREVIFKKNLLNKSTMLKRLWFKKCLLKKNVNSSKGKII